MQQQAWYLHSTAAALLLFKNTENLIAKLETYARGFQDTERETEIRTRLEELFSPQTRAVYGRVEVLPALDQVTPQQDVVTLVIFRPGPTAVSDITAFFNEQQYKNRLLFLTSDGARYSRVLDRSAYLRAVGAIISDLRKQNVREDDQQLRDAQDIQTREQASFYLACREAFTTLYYPSGQGLTPVPLDPRYGSNKYEGEAVIQQKLTDTQKYTAETGADSSFKNRVENILWPQGANETRWADIKRSAAQNSRWIWHHPRALDDLKDELVRRDTWREHDDGWIERGPFKPEPTAVNVQPLFRDPTTGEATLRAKGLRGDVVYFAEDGPVTTSSARYDGSDFKTKAVTVSFLCVDSIGEAETGEPYVWKNEITVKWDSFKRGELTMCELVALPKGDIVYTIDGSNPETSGQPYDGPFPLPAGKLVALQARAKVDGVTSATLAVTIDTKGEEQFQVNHNRPAVWKLRHKRDQTGDAYDFLKLAEQYQAQLGGIALVVAKEQRWADVRIDDNTTLEPDTVRTLIGSLQEIIPGSVSLEASRLSFSNGRDLQDMADDLRVMLKSNEVEQR